MIYFGCPKCGTPLQSPESQAGQTETCPECGNVAIVPAGQQEPPPTPQTPPQNQPVQTPPRRAKSVNGLGIASLVVGIVAVLGCWIPFVNVASMILAVLALIFGIAGLIIALTGQKSGVGMPVAGSIVSGVALLVAIIMNVVLGQVFSDVTDEARRSKEATDISTLSSACQLYFAETGRRPSSDMHELDDTGVQSVIDKDGDGDVDANDTCGPWVDEIPTKVDGTAYTYNSATGTVY